MKKIVVISGGNGSAITINALKSFSDIELSAVIPMSDSGGSSGQLRKKFNTLPVGDIMRATLAMSPYDYRMLKNIFYRARFQNAGKLDDHNLGNLFLVLAEQYAGDFLQAIDALHQAVQAIGRVHPVTLEPSDLCAELSNGDIVIGEHELDRPTYDRSLRIKRVWLQPTPMVHAVAKEAILSADFIFFGPGSFYCSMVAPLLVEGVKDAIRESKAKLIYIAGNAYEKHGETGAIRLSERIFELETYLPRPLDATVYSNHTLDQEEEKLYQEKNWGLIGYDAEACEGKRVIAEDYERRGGGVDSDKLGKLLHNSFFKK